MYYLYALMCPINNRPFYIGKGKGNRASQHLNKSEKWNKAKLSQIKALRALGYEPEAYIFANFDTEEEAFAHEHFFLNSGLVGLTNVSRHLGKAGSRPGKVEVDVELVRKLYIDQNKTKDQVCQELQIGKATINRVLDENDIIKLFTKICKPERIKPSRKYHNTHAYRLLNKRSNKSNS